MKTIKEINRQSINPIKIFDIPDSWYVVATFTELADTRDSFVEEANYRYVLEKFVGPYVDDVAQEIRVGSWAYSQYYVVVVSPDHPDIGRIQEIADFLEDYPIVCDETLERVRMEEYDNWFAELERNDYDMLEALKAAGLSKFMFRRPDECREKLYDHFIGLNT